METLIGADVGRGDAGRERAPAQLSWCMTSNTDLDQLHSTGGIGPGAPAVKSAGVLHFCAVGRLQGRGNLQVDRVSHGIQRGTLAR